MKIIDTHQHLWDLSQFPYSWCADIPALNRSFLPADYHAASAAAAAVATPQIELAGSVHVEADVDMPNGLDETRWLASLQGPGAPRALVASCRPEFEAFGAYLDILKSISPKIKGVRRVLHTQPDELSQAPLFTYNLQRLADYSLSFDLCLKGRQLPLGLALAEACPAVSFVVDHCGVPDIAGHANDGAALTAWQRDITRLAALPNTVCKLSGIVVCCGDSKPTAELLRPYTDHVLQSFGAQRVMWGSDWPVCTLAASYTEWVQLALQLTAHLSEADRQAVWHDNAVRVYRLEE